MQQAELDRLLAAGVLGDGLGAFADGVLGQFTGQEETHSGLDLSAGDGGSLVVVCEPGSFSGDPLEDVVDEAVHDGHGLAGNAGVWVNLLQDLVDVDGVGLPPPPLLFLVGGPGRLGLGRSLLATFACNTLDWHGYSMKYEVDS